MIEITQILPRLLRANPEVAVKLAWARTAGAGLRRQTTLVRLEEGTLIVAVLDTIWQKQLQQMSRELIFRLNNLLGQAIVRQIEFRIDPVMVSRSHPTEPAKAAKPETPVPTELLFAASTIADENLRARFVRAAGNCIARRESNLHK
jgi:hypothetical protein